MNSRFFAPRATLLSSVFLSVMVPACSSDSDPASTDPCSGTAQCTFLAAGTSSDRVQQVTAEAKKGDTIVFGEGTFTFTNQVTLAAENLTVRGAGIDKTVLDFSAQSAGSEGIFAQNVKNLLLEGFTVRDPKGNAIKVLKGEGVTFRKLKTHWTASDSSKHGAYGLYPVESSNVLVEQCVTIGASDTGIYVGQSKNIVVRHNEAYENVAGIEIENCSFADVYENKAHDNAGGIFVFDVPDLPVSGGHDIRVYKNEIRNNNTRNFAPGGLLANVPSGTGFFVLANSKVEVFENTFEGNNGTQTSIISYHVLREPIKDPNYKQPYPTEIFIHDNVYLEGGASPDTSKELGILLYTGMSKFPGGRVPALTYDGIVPDGTTDQINPMKICTKGNQGATFANLHLDKIDPKAPDLSKTVVVGFDGFECELPRLAPVSFPGL